MPEVKWVQKYSLHDGPQPIETGPITFVPVMTLDDLEAWLKAKPDEWMRVSTMLADVQAWKGQP